MAKEIAVERSLLLFLFVCGGEGAAEEEKKRLSLVWAHKLFKVDRKYGQL